MKKRKNRLPSSIKVDEKRPVYEIDIEEYKDKNFNWSIDTSFLCSPLNCLIKNCTPFCFSFEKLSIQELFEIFKKLNTYRSWTWRKIEFSKNGTSTGYMDVNKLDTKDMVIKHLQSKKLECHDKIYKIEIKGSHRVWGIRKNDVLFLLWNDPEHRFYGHKDKNFTKQKR